MGKPAIPEASKPAISADPVPPVTAREPLWGAKDDAADAKGAAPLGKTPEPMKPSGSTAARPSESDTNKANSTAKPESIGTTKPAIAASETATNPGFDLPPVAPAAPRRSAVPMVLAGVVTAGLGFGAAWLLWGPLGILAGNSAFDGRLTQLETQVASAEAETKAAAQAAANAAAAPLAARLDGAETALAGLDSISAQLAALEGQTEQARAAAASVDAKLTELAQRPPASDPAAVAAYERELAALRDTFAAQLAQIKADSDQVLSDIRAELGSELSRIEAEAKAAAQASEESAALQASAERAAALAALGAALDAGTALGDPLARLGAAAPEASLSGFDGFAEGVPTLLTLQETFPEAARAALSAQTLAGDGEGGIGGALKGFFGVRSLAPQDGNSTDAILSRAEAALATGDLRNTLSELDLLPAAPATKVQAWRADAERRLAALAAYTILSDAVEK